ncbi:MAG: hypothetical protein O6943_03410 [Bacteroidetes bacterium]|nr:hypothetical protein [Bacteroidota bacterium]
MSFLRKYANILLLFGSLLICFMFGEILLRYALFSGFLKNRISPHYFANLHHDDNVYRLLLKWQLEGKKNEPMLPEFDPLLGVTGEPVTPKNPLGLVTNKEYGIENFTDKRVILCYGNSFTEGFTDYQYKIPQLLDKSIANVSVLNFGASGYGLDQMYLRLKTTIDHFNGPHVIVSVIYGDLDRCLYEVMHTARPYYKVADGRLVLKGVPIPADYNKWLERYPLKPRCYVWEGLNGLVRRVLDSKLGNEYLFRFHPSETSTRKNEKKLLVYKLIESIKQLCDSRNAKFTFIFFPNRQHILHEGWYQVFLREVLEELKIDYIDFTEPLREYVKASGIKWYELYPNSSHPDNKENIVIAKHIAEHLVKNYDEYSLNIIADSYAISTFESNL